jgi:hypothetical protein
MFKFFRKIRRRILSENKFTRYLLYAIGEIVLVVIGILIALQINNRNEQSKNKQKYLKILKEVQNDAIKNIENSNIVLADYKKKDSLIELVLNNKLSYEDYASDNSGELRDLITSTSTIKIQNNGYLKLMQNMDIIAEDDTDFINLLNDNYIYYKYEIDRSVTRLDVITDRFLDYLAEHKKWFYIYEKELYDLPTGDYLEYFLEDPFYKNAVTIYQIGSRNNLGMYTLAFRASEIKICLKIAEILNNIGELPSDILPKKLNNISQDNLKTYEGTYEHKGGYTATFRIQDGHLVETEFNLPLYYKEKDHFTSSYLAEFHFIRDTNNLVVGLDIETFFKETWVFDKVN